MSSAGEQGPGPRTARAADALRGRLPLTDSLVLWGVALAVVLALLLRLLFLGDRVAHYDEGRVAYWSLHTLDTGHFAYRRIIHGPLLQHLDRYVFALFGATDFLMRLPVAIIGGFLPAAALLFRKHLRRIEVVAMAFVLAANPVLLYYSRFMRSDILVGAFMFVALGFLVRFYDTRRHRYLYGATAFVMLGIGSKENAVVYLLTWIGGAALLADHALFRPRSYDSGAHLLWAKATTGYGRLRDDHVRPWLDDVDTLLGRQSASNGGDSSPRSVLGRTLTPLRFAWYALVVVIIAVGIFLFIYAPRGAGYDGLTYPLGDAAAHLGLWDAVGNPTRLPALFDVTWDRFYSEFVRWITGSTDPGCHADNLIDSWACFAGRYLRVLGFYAAPTAVFALIGFFAERYSARKSRNLVMFSAYGGFVSVAGYALGTDIGGAWDVVHILIPLSIPAAVGVGLIARWGLEAYESEDTVGVGIAVALLVLSAGVAGFVMVDSVYTNNQADGNHLVQYAQPAGQIQDVLATMRTSATEHEGTDVLLYYGEKDEEYDDRNALVKENPATWDDGGLAKDPMCSRWHGILPLPWYFAASDASVACSVDSAELRETAQAGTVPVIVTYEGDQTVTTEALNASYQPRTYRLRTTDRPISYYVHEEYADQLRAPEPSAND